MRSRVVTCASLLALSVGLVGWGASQSTLAPGSTAWHEIATVWWWMPVIACVVFAGSLGLISIV